MVARLSAENAHSFSDMWANAASRTWIRERIRLLPYRMLGRRRRCGSARRHRRIRLGARPVLERALRVPVAVKTPREHQQAGDAGGDAGEAVAELPETPAAGVADHQPVAPERGQGGAAQHQPV